MTLKIAENIRNLRKSQGLTQEQLAEALGVTSGAVHKWESALSVPDITLIMELADFFEVSLDSLIGFNIRSGCINVVKERIIDLRRAKKFEEAVSECEKALQKYPNNFDIVYQSAVVFELIGVENRDKKASLRGVELYERSLLLLSQNSDPEISEFSIRSSIAEGYMTAGKHQEGIELLKKCNVSGVHDAFIGMTYSFSTDVSEAEKGLPYLTKSFGHIVEGVFRTMLGFANIYSRREELEKSLDAMLWLVDFLESVRENEDTVVYTEKSIAVLLAQCAIFADVLGKKDEADERLRKACFTAEHFDSNPNYKISGLKFCGDVDNTAVAYDDMGRSAVLAVEDLLSSNNEYQESKSRLLELWDNISSK